MQGSGVVDSGLGDLCSNPGCVVQTCINGYKHGKREE